MEGKLIRIRIKNTVRHIPPVPRKLISGMMSLTIPQVLNRKGGLIIGEGDTGKTTFMQMLYDEAKKHDKRAPILVKLRKRPQHLEVPDVPEGEVQTVIFDGLDEFPECARDIRDLTDNLDPERYHVWVTSRPCIAASIAAESRLLEHVHRLAPFTHKDVCKIARSVDIDGEAFISRVNEVHLGSFITKPGGAIILMQLFANGMLEPSGQTAHSMNTAVMETIMHDFARETRDGDDEAVPKLSYTEPEIVEATCWIAACLVFSGRDAIWIGPKANCPANDICLDDLPPREYGTNLFKAAVGLRLFEPLSPMRYRLAYSEMPAYLAGRWLARHFPVEKLKELPLFPISVALRSMSLRAIAWASAYNMAFIEDYFLKYPSYFLRFHARIEKTGFNKFFTALCRENIYGYDDFDDDDPEYYSLIVESNFAGCTEFAKMLQDALDSNQYSFRDEEYIEAFLAACESKPLYSYRLPSLERDDDEDMLFDDPLPPAELDALAPIKRKPVNAIVVGTTDAAREEVAQAVAKATKNKGGRPKKTPGKHYTQKQMAGYFGPPCTKDDVSNWERYDRYNGTRGGSPPPIGTYKGQTVTYSAALRENVEGENIDILGAIVREYRATHPDNPRPADVKFVHPRSEESRHRMKHPDGKVRTQNHNGAC